MAKLTAANFFYNLKTEQDQSLKALFSKNYLSFQIGAGYAGNSDEVLLSYRLTKEFDALLLVWQTTALSDLPE